MLYPKINGVFKRDGDGNFTDEFSQPEFKDLLNVKWRGTEKVDGTNIRVYINDDIIIKGRTDRATISQDLIDYIYRLDIFRLEGVELFGEGYGGKIQAGTGYSDRAKFILFDAVTPTKRFLTREELTVIPVQRVHEYESQTLSDWIEMFRAWDFPPSQLREGPAEGVVLIPENNYLDMYGHRIITKLKVKDFQ